MDLEDKLPRELVNIIKEYDPPGYSEWRYKINELHVELYFSKRTKRFISTIKHEIRIETIKTRGNYVPAYKVDVSEYDIGKYIEQIPGSKLGMFNEDIYQKSIHTTSVYSAEPKIICYIYSPTSTYRNCRNNHIAYNDIDPSTTWYLLSNDNRLTKGASGRLSKWRNERMNRIRVSGVWKPEYLYNSRPLE